MNKLIPDEVIEQVRSVSDIVEVIADYVRLTKKGRNYVGLCPFHHEKTPSFMVSPDKQIFHCFGCSVGGNAFSFIMQRENVNFPEAIRILAKRYGISVPDPAESQDPEFKLREKVYEINDLSKNFFQYFLLKHNSAREGREYLNQRGITPEVIDDFQLGFAPPAWDTLVQFMRKKGFSAEQLEKAGMVLPKTKGTGGYYDRFRNRIIFPVWNETGRVAGFGGRVLDSSLPKYLNSPETLVFNKSRLLYGLNKAAESIRQNDNVIIVEGYLDVITCHQAGIRNVVASLGTALTREQGKLLMRFTREVTIAYDADAAGVNAAVRGLQVLDELGCRVKVVTIPDGKDPDEFIRKQGPDKFLRIIHEQALFLCDYLTERAMEKFDFFTLEGKFKIASEVIPIIKNLSNEIEKDEATMKLAQRLHLSPEAIRAEVEKNSQSTRNSWGKRDKITGARDNNTVHPPPGSTGSPERDARTKAEDVLLRFMLNDRRIFEKVKNEIGVHFSSRNEYVSIIKALGDCADNQLDFEPARIFDYVKDKSAEKFFSLLMVQDFPQGDSDKIISDCLSKIKEDETRKKREDLLRQMEEADRLQDFAKRQKLLEEYSKLI